MFLNKILSDAKKQSAVETQLLEDKSEVLDAMYETVEADNKILAQVKDTIPKPMPSMRKAANGRIQNLPILRRKHKTSTGKHSFMKEYR